MVVVVTWSRCIHRAGRQQPVYDVTTRLLVLVTEQGVDEGVAGRLAVGQALGDHSPTVVDRHGRK